MLKKRLIWLLSILCLTQLLMPAASLALTVPGGGNVPASEPLGRINAPYKYEEASSKNWSFITDKDGRRFVFVGAGCRINENRAVEDKDSVTTDISCTTNYSAFWATRKIGNDFDFIRVRGDDKPGPATTGFAEAEWFRYQGSTVNGTPITIRDANPDAEQEAAKNSTGKNGVTPDCESSGVFGWIYCGIFEGIEESAEFIERVIQDFLVVEPLSTDTSPENATFAIWKLFRNLANAGFVLVFLFIIFANVLSLNIDAYTIKKMLPRLVAASILVQFSYLIVSLGVDITNILGAGIRTMIDPVLTSSKAAGGNVAGLLSGGGLLAASIALIAGIANGTVILALIAAFFAILAVFFTLIIRQVLITLLIIVSPIAFIAWVLPNTDNLFKTWSKTFVRVLLMYPMIILLFAAGDIFGMATTVTPGKGVAGDQVKAITSLLAQIVPLFMVPATFAFAGKAMTAVAGLAGGLAAKGAKGARNSQFSKDFLQARKEKNLLRTQSGNKAARTFGKMGAGGVLPTSAGKRRLAAGYAGVLESQGKDLEELFTNENFGTDDFRAISGMKNGDVYEKTGSDGSKVKVKVNDAARYKALSKMVDFRDYDGLREKKGTLGKTAPWRQAMAKNVGDIIKGAPDLIQGNNAFKTLSADQVAGFHHSTIDSMVKSLNDPGVTAEQKQRTFRTITQVMDSPALRSRVTNEGWGNIRRAADQGVFNGVPTDTAGVSAAEYLKDGISDGGPVTKMVEQPDKTEIPVEQTDEWGTKRLGFLKQTKKKDDSSDGGDGSSSRSGSKGTPSGGVGNNDEDPDDTPNPPSGGGGGTPSGGGSGSSPAGGSGGIGGSSSPSTGAPSTSPGSPSSNGGQTASTGSTPGTPPVTEVGPTEPSTRFTVGPSGETQDQTPRFSVGPSGVTADRENPSPLTANSDKPRPREEYFTINNSGGRVPVTEEVAKKAAQKGDEVYPISELDKPRPRRAEGPGFIRRGVQGTVGGIGDIATGLADITDQAKRVTKNVAGGAVDIGKAKVTMAKADAEASVISASATPNAAPSLGTPAQPIAAQGFGSTFPSTTPVDAGGSLPQQPAGPTPIDSARSYTGPRNVPEGWTPPSGIGEDEEAA